MSSPTVGVSALGAMLSSHRKRNTEYGARYAKNMGGIPSALTLTAENTSSWNASCFVLVWVCAKNPAPPWTYPRRTHLQSLPFDHRRTTKWQRSGRESPAGNKKNTPIPQTIKTKNKKNAYQHHGNRRTLRDVKLSIESHLLFV